MKKLFRRFCLSAKRATVNPRDRRIQNARPLESYLTKNYGYFSLSQISASTADTSKKTAVSSTDQPF